MMTDVSVEGIAQRLWELLQSMKPGETLRVIGSDGEPLALVVSLRQAAGPAKSPREWEAEWDALADAVTRAWKTDKSAVQVIAEMRR